jgi:dimethylhistidine N-methyltransferase
MLANFKIYNSKCKQIEVADPILQGLMARRKRLPSSLLYDEEGMALLGELQDQEEYYAGRTEVALLEKYGAEIAELIGPSPLLFEFDANNPKRVRQLLKHIQGPCSYMGVNPVTESLLEGMRGLAREFPNVQVIAIKADFNAQPPFPPEVNGGRRVFFYPGSAIGSLPPHEARSFLGNIRELVGKRGCALFGVDLRKDPEVVRRAYNDARGLSSRFELRALERLNNEHGANFDLEKFRYLATYNPKLGRVEMYLVASQNQQVTLLGQKISFKKGETIHIEDSFKYSIDEFHTLARKSGFETTMTWLDKENWFSMNLLLP